MRRTPWWTLLSAIGAPVFLIGGWTVAARLQPPDYDATRDTISALAGIAATDRWVMTLGIAGLGLCHLVTAAGLRPVARPGRLVLAIGGAATLCVAALPLPRAGPSSWHGIAALIGFVSLALWPACAALSRRSETTGPLVLRRGTGLAATVVLLSLVIWFGLSLRAAHLVGLSERIAAGAESLWPLLVVAGCRLTQPPPVATSPPGDHEVSRLMS
jgi:hypothetical membrane protein